MIDPNYCLIMSQGGYIDSTYVETHVYETQEKTYEVYKLTYKVDKSEPEEILLESFVDLQKANEFAINYFN